MIFKKEVQICLGHKAQSLKNATGQSVQPVADSGEDLLEAQLGWQPPLDFQIF